MVDTIKKIKMEAEKTPIEILEEFAGSTNRTIKYENTPYPSSAMHPIKYHKQSVYIPENKDQPIYFICFSDPKQLDKYSVYSGVLMPVNAPSSSYLNVRRKDILDKLNPLIKRNLIKTGNYRFDSKAVSTSNEEAKFTQLLNHRKVQELILKVFELNKLLVFTANELNTGFIPGLENKSTIGFFNRQTWILEYPMIEKLFNHIKELNSLIENHWFLSNKF